MRVLQTTTFRNTIKKLYKDQKLGLDNAINDILNNPRLGTLKKGDLRGVYVYKFHIDNQLMLLAYTYTKSELTLLAIVHMKTFIEI